MAKKVEGYIKLQIAAGNATPAPPVGPALGQKGVNIMDFCKQFNAKLDVYFNCFVELCLCSVHYDLQ